MKRLAIALLAGSAWIGGAAFAQDEREQSSATQASAEVRQPHVQDEELTEEEQRMQEVICKTERITGSLVRRKRICMTREEWNDIGSNAQEGHAEMVRSASGNKCFGC